MHCNGLFRFDTDKGPACVRSSVDTKDELLERQAAIENIENSTMVTLTVTEEKDILNILRTHGCLYVIDIRTDYEVLIPIDEHNHAQHFYAVDFYVFLTIYLLVTVAIYIVSVRDEGSLKAYVRKEIRAWKIEKKRRKRKRERKLQRDNHRR